MEESYRQQVEVFVSDNGSTDNTASVIEKHAVRFGLQFRAVSIDVNRGMDFNFSRCYEACDTPYAWLVGDDDVILPGGIRAVLDVLSEHSVDLLYLNHYWFKRNYTQHPMIGDGQGVTLYCDRFQFARRVNIMLTYLSGIVVRTGFGASYRAQIENSNLIQLSWVLPLLRDGQRFAVIERWTIAAKGSNSGGYGLIKVFGSNMSAILALVLGSGSLLAKIITNGVLVNFFPGPIANLKCETGEFKSEQNWKKMLRSLYSDNWRFYIFIWPLTVLPGRLARGYYFLLKGIRFVAGDRLV